MTLIDLALAPLSAAKHRLSTWRLERRWRRLRQLGMHIGKDVNLPGSTFIDESHCFLISIGDNCGFGEDCHILAHDAQMDEYLDAARLGRVIIHDSCHIGARTVILPGLEIGPRTLVGAHSLVSRTLPANSVCAGVPAKVICSLDEYLDKHREALRTAPTFDYITHSMGAISNEEKAAMKRALAERDGYMVGGRSAMMRGEGWPKLTAADTV